MATASSLDSRAASPASPSRSPSRRTGSRLMGNLRRSCSRQDLSSSSTTSGSSPSQAGADDRPGPPSSERHASSSSTSNTKGHIRPPSTGTFGAPPGSPRPKTRQMGNAAAGSGAGSNSTGWLSNMLQHSNNRDNPHTAWSGRASGERAGTLRDDDVASIASTSTSHSFSPSKLLKRSQKPQGGSTVGSTASPSGPVASAPTRMTGLDRMLDRAMQYFTDSDSNVDRCPDDIWLLGMRHDGWRADYGKDPGPRASTSSSAYEPSPQAVPTDNNFSKSNRLKKSSHKQGDQPQQQTEPKRRFSKASLGSDSFSSSREDETSPGSSSSSPSRTSSKTAAFFSAIGGKNGQETHSPKKLLGGRSSSHSSSTQGHGLSQTMSRLSSSSSGASASSPPAHLPSSTPPLAGTPPALLSSSYSVASGSSSHSIPTVHSISPAEIAVTQTNGWPPAFYHDFYSRIQLTYRSSFPGIPSSVDNQAPPASSAVSGAWSSMLNGLSASLGRSGPGASGEGLTSDAGWGCMLRTGQSLLANALADLHLGREWRHPLPAPATSASSVNLDSISSHPLYPTYVRLISWFFDEPSPLAPFSVHKFAVEGERLGKRVGEWFGPSTAAGAIKTLTNSFPPANLGVALAIDTTVYKSEVFAVAGVPLLSKSSIGPNADTEQEWKRPVLILVPLRLGINGVNPIYFDSIKHYFTLPQCVGIAGGRPSSSYYFVGAQNESLFYIDPHHTKPSVKKAVVPEDIRKLAESQPLSSLSREQDRLHNFFRDAYAPSDLLSFHCDKVRKMALSGLDPSMLVGLLCQDKQDWYDLERRMRSFGSEKDARPIIHLVDHMPGWMRNPGRSMSNMGKMSVSVTDAVAMQTKQSIPVPERSPGGPGRRSPLLLSKSPDDADSVDYADSDDWDIDDSESDSNLGVESVVEQASVGSLQSIYGPASSSGIPRTKPDHNSHEEGWTEASPAPSPSRSHHLPSQIKPVRQASVDPEMDAVVVPPTPRPATQTDTAADPDTSDVVHVEVRGALQSEVRDADWQGISNDRPRVRQTSSESADTQTASLSRAPTLVRRQGTDGRD